MFDELRMALAELALTWALSIAPDNWEGRRLASTVHRYLLSARARREQSRDANQ